VWVARNLDRQDAWRFLAWTQLAAVAVLLITPLMYRGLPYLAGYEVDDSFAERMMRYAITSAAILGPSMLLIGVVLPCTWKIAAADLAHSGRVVGLLTGVNTLAAVAGSMAAGFVLLPRLGLGLTSLTVTCVYGGVAILAMLYGFRGTRRWLGCGACLAMLVGWFLLGGWRVQLLRLEQGQKLISFHDGADATVAVLQRADGHRVLKVNHDYILGSSAGADREVRQGRLPLILHPDPKRVAFVGVATGMTVSAVLDFPVERVAAVELLHGVADTLPLFAKWNGNVADDPRVEIVVEDGRNFLAGTNEQFDVIISDLFVPWHAGTGDLYSVELFQTARERLAPGGLFAQSLPGYQLSVEELRTITASFLKVFPNTVLWRNDYNLDYPILCLTGFRDDLRLDAEAVRQHAQRLRSTTGTPATFLAGPDGLPLLFVCGPPELAEWCAGATLNTDNYPLIEFSSPKSLFQHKQKEIQPVHDFLAGVRSHSWPFDQQPAEKPVQELFRIADLVIAAQKAFSENNFELEFQRVSQLARLAGDSPSVAVYVMSVANRYQSRRMSDRGTELLEALVAFPEPPVPVLVALAQDYKVAGNDQGATELLEEAVKRSPEMFGTRKTLAEMLDHEGEHAKAEPHLRELIKTRPEDPYLRIDLAKNLHRQGKTEEARAAIDEFLETWDGSKRKEVWRYLRTSGLGPYVDRVAPRDEPVYDESLPDNPSSTTHQENGERP
jgi:tetratricopeptide (TPR) repeat protein